MPLSDEEIVSFIKETASNHIFHRLTNKWEVFTIYGSYEDYDLNMAYAKAKNMYKWHQQQQYK